MKSMGMMTSSLGFASSERHPPKEMEPSNAKMAMFTATAIPSASFPNLSMPLLYRKVHPFRDFPLPRVGGASQCRVLAWARQNKRPRLRRGLERNGRTVGI